MRKFGVLLWVGVFIALAVNGQGELGDARSSRESVEQSLERMGVHVGDLERGRIVVIGTSRFSMKGEESGDTWGLKETYDFPDETGDDHETRRFKAVWKAYANGLAGIASYFARSEKRSETKDENERIVSNTLNSSTVQSLVGVVFLTMAESCTADGEYEVTVAVCQSQKSAEAFSRGLNGGGAKPGKYTLDEWVKQKAESGLGVICPQSYCDNEGVWWRVAGVPVDLSEGRNSKKVAVQTEKAKHSAYEAAMRTLAVRVSTSTSLSVIDKSHDGDEQKEKMERSVKIDPINTVLPVDPSQARWFELERMNPLTGNPVRYVVAALRSGNSKNVAAESASVPAKADVRESAKAKQITANDRQMDAEEQAHRFCMENGLELGFNSEKRVITLVSSGRFDYEPQMSDEEFARRRYLAVKRALMVGAISISSELDMRGDVHQVQRNTERRHGITDLGHVVDIEDEKDQVYRFMGRKYLWAARLEGTRSTLSVEMKRPLYGISILGQFESLSEDMYKVALIVSFDVEKGKEKISAFQEGKTDAYGKMSLRQWVETQDFSLIAGPRLYVDNDGISWAVGIVPAADGQKPHGALLDAVARECAAFAFGGDIELSVRGSENSHFLGSRDDEKTGGYIALKENRLGDLYPRELELYFRRSYTHPVTGRKGVVAICALRGGASKIMEKITARKMEEMRERKYEEGMRAGMREQLKTLANELEKVNADDDETSMRIRALGREISRFESELQQERSSRKKNRERTTKKYAELRRKVLELKGGKDNEE